MPLVMLSSRLIVMCRQAGYCGSHFPIGSLIDSLPAASSCSRMTEVKALVLLPIGSSVLVDTGPPPEYRFVPAARLMACVARGNAIRSETAEMCSAFRRAVR